MTPENMERPYDLDFDGIFKVRMERGSFPFLEKKLSIWESSFEHPDLTVSKGEVSNEAFPMSSHQNDAEADGLVSEKGYQIIHKNSIYEIESDRITCKGSVLELYLEYMVIMPVINRMITQQGNFLAHAAGVSVNGGVLILPGISGTGKTSVMLELLSRGAAYMGNNNVFINRSGRCTLYSPWISFPERNARLFPELMVRLFPSSKERRRHEKRLSFYQMGMSLNGRNFVSRYLKSNLVSRFFDTPYAKYDEMFPGCKAKKSGTVTHAFLLERRRADPRVIKAGPEEIAKLATMSDWIADSNSHNILAELAGLRFCTRNDINELFTDFFGHAECYRIRIPANETRKGIKETADMIEDIVS